MADESKGVGSTAAEPDPYVVAREIALRALDRRAYPRAELAQYLQRKGVDEQVIEPVLNRFEEVGLIDDEAFASQWVESRHQGRKLPRRALVAELRRKGLAEEVIAEAVEPIDEEAEIAAAQQFAAARARTLTGHPREVALRRLVGALGRKGFSGELAWSAAKAALQGWDETDPGMGA